MPVSAYLNCPWQSVQFKLTVDFQLPSSVYHFYLANKVKKYEYKVVQLLASNSIRVG